MILFLVASVVISSILSITSHIFARKLYYFIKPIPILFLIAACLHSFTSFQSPSIVWIFFVGLILGLAGDIFLLWDKFFIPGLAAFLSGHIMYIIYFTQLSQINLYFLFASLIITLLYAYFFFKKIDPIKKRKFLFPVYAYMITITFMLAYSMSADFRLYDKFFLFSTGGLLFYISDAILAIDKLIEHKKFYVIPVLSAYYMGQLMLTLGVLRTVGIL